MILDAKGDGYETTSLLGVVMHKTSSNALLEEDSDPSTCALALLTSPPPTPGSPPKVSRWKLVLLE